jgi:hypothetical protein
VQHQATRNWKVLNQIVQLGIVLSLEQLVAKTCKVATPARKAHPGSGMSRCTFPTSARLTAPGRFHSNLTVTDMVT